jgi:hypothetical protein
MRRTVRAIVCMGLCAALGGALAGTASASVADKSVKKFCKRALAAGADLTSVEGTTNEDAAADLEKSFKKLAKLAPTRKIKKAAKKIAGYYGDLADGDTPDADLSTEYVEASGTFSTYLVEKCIVSEIPDEIPGLDELPGS